MFGLTIPLQVFSDIAVFGELCAMLADHVCTLDENELTLLLLVADLANRK